MYIQMISKSPRLIEFYKNLVLFEAKSRNAVREEHTNQPVTQPYAIASCRQECRSFLEILRLEPKGIENTVLTEVQVAETCGHLVAEVDVITATVQL